MAITRSAPNLVAANSGLVKVEVLTRDGLLDQQPKLALAAALPAPKTAFRFELR